jgi:hypothetical protein
MKIFRRSQYRQELHFDYPVFEKVQEYMWLLNQKPEHLIFYIWIRIYTLYLLMHTHLSEIPKYDSKLTVPELLKDG